jgi:ATP-dependent DNA helicase RecG
MDAVKTQLKALKIYTLLDLALLLPTSYNDTTLSVELTLGSVNTLEAEVIESRMYKGKLRITFKLTKFRRRLSATMFRTTPYHYDLFSVGSHHVIQGKLEEYRGFLQMSQPKSIKEIGKVTPKYKTALKESEVKELLQTYVTEKGLFNEGLDSKEVATIMRIHFPKSIEEVYEKGRFRPEVVEVLKFVEAYNHVKKLKGKRVDFKALRALDGGVDGFIKSLPFRLTVDQQQVIDQIQVDLLQENKAAKRLVVGDVGSGKTMVILASVMMALPHKSILMAPTSLLALQLYEEAMKFLPKSVKVALVMQGKNEGSVEEADFILGTHALLYMENLPQASLVMVDEQHRFGTGQRQHLDALSSEDERKPHYLQFSATPIPRTQAMMESEIIDVSLMTTTPFERTVETSIIGKAAFPTLLQHIKEEIGEGHQVLVVYPLVEPSEEVPYQSLEEAQGYWQKHFEEVYVTHGKDKQKDEVLLGFREKGSILLSTTVIEVGISLPKLTLMVIVGAERMGLATLHQLRGRVGRYGLQSWCYLYSNTPKSQRLQDFAKTTNGFDIAKLDLLYRDSGDILDGTMQSGQKFKWLDLATDEEVVKRAKNRLHSQAL